MKKMTSLLSITTLFVGMTVGMAAVSGGAEKQNIPMSDPQEIMRIRPAPGDAKPGVSKAQALLFAARYSGFELGDNVEPSLALYFDREEVFCAEKVKSPFQEPTLAWIVPVAGASVTRDRGHGNEAVACPFSIAIAASSGEFLGAYGQSCKKWAKSRQTFSDSGQTHVLRKTKAPPRLTVRDVLQRFYDPYETGQFFVRYCEVTVTVPYG